MKEITPPHIANKLFEWFCRDASVEDLHGDMEELFYVNLTRMPVWRAKLRFWIHTFSLITSYAVRKRKRQLTVQQSSIEQTIDMLKSYLLIASRSLAKHKFFTIINVLGLAIGMSVSLLFIAMVTFVATYDNFHANKDRIYRVTTKINLMNNQEFARTPLPLAEKLNNEYQGVEEVVRIDNRLSGEAEFNNKQIQLQGFFVDPNFLDVFSFPMLKGNAALALAKPHGLVITEAGAERIFGTEDPIGKIIKLERYGEFEITGLLKNAPKNSHLQFEILVPFQVLETFARNQDFVSTEKRWEDLSTYTYLLMPMNFSENDLQAIATFTDKIANGAYSKESEFKASFKLQSLEDIAPGSGLAYEISSVWDVAGFIFFGVLTLFILLPACFNYTNISISRALKRSKEISLRKVVGGQRNQIFFQFILETVIVTLLALALSYVLFTISRNEFSSLVFTYQFLDLTPTPITILYFIAFAVFVGIVAGVVPALYFSKLNPIQALKSKSTSKASKGSLLRKSLVVGQFALSLGFIMAVAITLKQQVATLNYNFGFDQANILDVKLQGVDPDVFRNEFSKLSSVQTVSMSSTIMGASAASHVWVPKPEENDSTDVLQMFVDHNYLNNLNLKLIAGKSFTDQYGGREHSIIVNEEFLKKFNISSPSEALSQSFIFAGAGELKIVGVVKNFHHDGLSRPIQSFVFRYDSKQFKYANLKVASDDMLTAFANMESAWKGIGKENKFEAKFFDDEIEEAYAEYFSMVKICGFLGFLAITISCLGLLGMVVYATETRTKEIGVRKVMGASSATIAILLSKGYVKLMLMATLIATPITYFFFDVFLFGEQYYRIGIGALEIVASILLMLLLGIATVLSQTLKAAKANPVDTLRYE